MINQEAPPADAVEARQEPSSGDGQSSARLGHRAGGRFQLGNTVAMTHGATRRQPLVNVEQSALFQSWAADLGGIDELTAGEKALLMRAVEADAIAAGAMRYLSRCHRSLTSPRVLAAIDVWATASSQLRSLGQTLGIRRRQKHVDPMDAVRQAVAEANRK